ncbi:type II secretion system F family protein, partial [Staphylococcus chromogenes]|uniref:type II secretion system F family protein n=1 Tax=Staphylococcus chromogenes TaxID=46126 RepID=UPI000D4C9B22
MNKLYESIKNKYQMYLLKKQHLTLMIRLHALLSHGFTLVEAMTFLFKQLNVKDKTLVNSFTLMLKNGSTCYELLKFLKFPNTILMQLYFAERYSALPSTLKQCHIFYKQNQKLVSQFYKSIQYPLLLLLIFIFFILILHYTMMPVFLLMYQSIDITVHLFPLMIQR